LPGPTIGIGTALRKAREHRSKTIEEASRDTKIRAEYLRALERESFEALLGDVYVRGFLRSYSRYLGLDPDKVVSAYTSSVGEPEPSELPIEALRPDRASNDRLFRTGDRRSSWILAGGIALTLLIIAGAFGLLSRSRSTPQSAALPSTAPSVAPVEQKISVALIAKHQVNAVITIDGVEAFAGELSAREARSFQGAQELSVSFSRGGVVSLTVNGKDLGTPGNVNEPYSQTFFAEKGGTPSPAG